MKIEFIDPTEQEFEDSTEFSTAGEHVLISITQSNASVSSNLINKDQAKELIEFIKEFINK